MNALKGTLLSIFCLYLFFSAHGQNPGGPIKGNGRISGVISDSLTNAPVEFANVALIDKATGKPVNGTVCDDKGKFQVTKVANGNYQVVISFIGYESKKINLQMTDKATDRDLGAIPLRVSTELLNEVVVEGQKALVEEKVDRMIYNAENDLTTKGGDATDVLKRVPQLSVDVDGNVSLRGSANIKVLINNKPSTITASSVGDALKQIPADMIKNVEVITSPSSRYDAEGSAGIINIVLKKNTLEGVFLTADGSVGNRGTNLSANASYRRGKMGFSFGGFNRATYNVHGDFTNDQVTIDNGKTFQNLQSARTRSDGLVSQYTFGWDYDVNKFNALSVSVRYGQQNQNGYQDDLLTEKYSSDGTSSSDLKNIKTTNVSQNLDASLTYTKTFEKKLREFNFLAIFSQNDPVNGFTTNTVSPADNSIITSAKNNNQGHTREVTFQADFQEPLSPTQLLEFGAKDIIRNVTSDYQYFVAQGSNGEYQPDPNPVLTNNFKYDQTITSGYVAYTLTALKDYTFKAGGRYEYTNIDAKFQGGLPANIPSYGVLVPSINFSRKLKNGNLIKVSYNRRIQRPSLRDLNPNIQSSNSISVSVGNPYLKPEYADNYEIAYKTAYKTMDINIATYVRYNTNDIQPARTVRNDTIFSVAQNIGTEANYGASLFTTLPISEKFSVTAGADLYYRILKNNSPVPELNATNQGLVQNYRVFGSYNFSKTLAMQFFVFFQGKNYNLQGYRTNPINHSISVKKDIWGKKGTLGLGVDNFLTPSYVVYSELNSSYLKQSTSNTLYNFLIRVNFSYKIGKLAPERKRKSFEDVE